MDSLQDILGKHRFQAPDEAKALEDYLMRKYKVKGRVKVDDNSVVLSVTSSALASTLQLERTQIARKLGIKKRLVIRTGR